jgi:hypothetical protein
MTKFQAIYSYLIFSMVSISSNHKVSEMDRRSNGKIRTLCLALLYSCSFIRQTFVVLDAFPSLLSVSKLPIRLYIGGNLRIFERTFLEYTI